LLPNPLYGTPGGGGPYNAWATNQCTLQDEQVTAGGWTSSNPSVATVNSTGYTSFVAPGSSTITAAADLKSVENCCCRPQMYQAQAPAIVCPNSTTVSKVDPYGVELLYPNIDTGIGSIATIQVSPSTPTGTQIMESLTVTSNSCPSNSPWPTFCTSSPRSVPE